MGGSVCFRVWEIGGFFFSLSFLFGNLTARNGCVLSISRQTAPTEKRLSGMGMTCDFSVTLPSVHVLLA